MPPQNALRKKGYRSLAFQVGDIVEGKITGIKPFGAFVALPDHKNGLVHISEVSYEFVQDLSTVLSEGQTVQVKVMSIAPDGKIALSIKRTQPAPERGSRPPRKEHGGQQHPGGARRPAAADVRPARNRRPASGSPSRPSPKGT